MDFSKHIASCLNVEEIVIKNFRTEYRIRPYVKKLIL